MKKFMKICGITAIIFIILGTVIAVATFSMGGTKLIHEVVEQVSDGKVKINMDHLNDWSINVEELPFDSKAVKGGIYHIEENQDIIDFNKDYETFFDKMAKTSLGHDIKKLDIKSGGCEFLIRESTDHDLWLEATKVGAIQGYVEDGTLYIHSKVEEDGILHLGISDISQVVLYVPSDFRFENIDISFGAGELTFDKMKTAKSEIEVGAGKITLNQLQADEVALNVGVGEIQAENVQVGSMKANTGMGNLELSGSFEKNAELKCAMGNISLEINGEEEDFNYTVDCSMGNVTVGSREYSGLAQNKDVDNQAEKNMNLECSMGNIEVSFR